MVDHAKGYAYNSGHENRLELQTGGIMIAGRTLLLAVATGMAVWLAAAGPSMAVCWDTRQLVDGKDFPFKITSAFETCNIASRSVLS
jgi:hypothetical protein